LTTKKETDDKKRTWFTFVADWDSDDKGAAGARLTADHPAVQLGALLVKQKADGSLKMAEEPSKGEQPDTGSSQGYTGGARGGSGNTGDDDDPPF